MVEKLKELPITPNVGDGLIWDGVQWIKVHPHQTTHALLYYMKLNDELVAALESIKSTCFNTAEAALSKARGEV